MSYHAAIRFTADQGNVHGCGCVYSDWCLNSEVQFTWFSVSVLQSISIAFRFVVCRFRIFGDANVLSKMCKLLLHLVRFFANICSHFYNFILQIYAPLDFLQQSSDLGFWFPFLPTVKQ